VEDVPFYKTTDLSIGKQVGITKPGFVLTRNYADKVPGAKGEAAFLARPVRALCASLAQAALVGPLNCLLLR